MNDDGELLRRYAMERAEDAFTELVRRHVDLVYSVALRRTGGDAHLAADVAQRVFTALARQATALAQHVVLTGWLYTTTRHIAIDTVRSRQRREAREREAQAMQEMNSPSAPEAAWEQLRPVLDDVLDELPDRDREAVLLRFLAQRPFAEIGAVLRVSEDAARMRVDRALEKLRTLLERRGLTSTGAALALTLGNQAMTAAPAGLAANIAGVSLAAGASVGTGAVATLGTLLVMSKIKTGIVAAIVVAVAVPAAWELRANRTLAAELGALRAAPADVRALQKEGETLNAALASSAGANPEIGELARLRQRVAHLSARPPGVVEAEFKPASQWRNVGRATPQAANETFHWALFHRDVPTVVSFITFEDDTPENRAAFMAKLTPAIRARYPTPELVAAAAFFGAGAGLATRHHPDDAFQLFDIRPDDRPGMTNTKFWYRLASGKERPGSSRWLATPNGFVLDPHSLTRDVDFILGRFDPATGELRPLQPVELDSRGRPIPARK